MSSEDNFRSGSPAISQLFSIYSSHSMGLQRPALWIKQMVKHLYRSAQMQRYRRRRYGQLQIYQLGLPGLTLLYAAVMTGKRAHSAYLVVVNVPGARIDRHVQTAIDTQTAKHSGTNAKVISKSDGKRTSRTVRTHSYVLVPIFVINFYFYCNIIIWSARNTFSSVCFRVV